MARLHGFWVAACGTALLACASNGSDLQRASRADALSDAPADADQADVAADLAPADAPALADVAQPADALWDGTPDAAPPDAAPDVEPDAGCACGDGVCDPACGETATTCPADCNSCGNSVCEPGEGPKSCKVDCCGACGDGKCRGYDCGESPEACPQDCGAACGNKACDKGESPATCAEDCVWQACGNGVCEPADGGPAKCPQDCGTACGDGKCESGEDFLGCPVDCGYCGDGFCVPELGEGTATCPADCQMGECTPGLPAGVTQCDDKNPCTIDQCAPAGVCHHPPAQGGACDDGSACTTGDHCSFGTCQLSNLLDCDDDNPCTADKCDPKKGCHHPASADACDDGNVCTVGDACKGGACKSGSPLDCEDGNPCTSNACDSADGCTSTVASAPCTDGDLCTTGDACAAGACAGAGQLACDDGNPCSTDSCLPESGCAHVAVIGSCEDGNACTTGDLCANGVCTAGAALGCADGTPCTFDSCDGLSGCQHKNAIGACDDGNGCTVADVCKNGSCSGGEAKNCEDGNPCTTDSCAPASGCTSTVADSNACSDGNPCTVGDACSAGVCAGHGPPPCDDGNACTDDACGAASGCTHAVNSANCNDNSVCTVGDHCAAGGCVGTTALDCSDADPCTNDSCNPASGCDHSAGSGNACNDGNICTISDVCTSGVCAGSAGGCDDGNACTDDACAGGTACLHTGNSAACEDGDACTSGDVCAAKVCKGGAAMICTDNNLCTEGDHCLAGACMPGIAAVCDDGNACTTDSCDKALGCQYGDNGGAVCGGYGVCGGGQCACPGGWPMVGQQCPPIVTGISLTGANLSPAFDLAQAGYEASVPVTVDHVALRVDAPAGVAVTMSLNGGPIATLVLGQALDVALQLGPNKVALTALHGGMGKAFSLTVTRLPTLQQAYVKAANTAAGDGFGSGAPGPATGLHNGQAIAISAETLVVGAPTEDSDATGMDGDGSDNGATDSGAVYVYRRSGTAWALEAYIKPAVSAPGALFGASVALSGDTLVVGAPKEGSSPASVAAGAPDLNGLPGSGAVFVFLRQNGLWSQRTLLKANNAEAGDTFGQSVAISGTSIAVGAPMALGGAGGPGADNFAWAAGAAYVFVEEHGAWQQQGYLKAAYPDVADMFGHAVAISDDTVVVGAPWESSKAGGVDGNEANNGAKESGAAYVFSRTGTSWSQQAYLKANNPDALDFFGVAVAVSGTTIVVGAPHEDGDGAQASDNTRKDSGAAYVFARTGGKWTQSAYLKAAFPDTDDSFGSAVAVDGGMILVGAPAESGGSAGVGGDQTNNAQPSSGAAFLFVQQGASWSQSAYLKAQVVDGDDAFGAAVALSGNKAAVAAPGEASNATGIGGSATDNSMAGAGAVYLFSGDVCYFGKAGECDDANPCTIESCNVSQFCGHAAASDGAICGGTGACEAGMCGCPAGDLDWNGVCRPGLANLDISAAALSMPFAPPRRSYWLSAPPPIDAFTVTATAAAGITLALAAADGQATPLQSGQPSNPVPLPIGATSVVVLASEGGVTTRYDVAIQRPPAVQDAYLKPSNTGAQENFGSAMTADGDTLVVAAQDESSCGTGVNGSQENYGCDYAGAVYVFVRQDQTWVQQAYLKASNSEESDQFGTAVAISGDTLVVGAIGEDGGAFGVDGAQADNSQASSGAAYVFVRQDGVWSQQAYLKASNTGKDDKFGSTVAIFGDTIVVGAPGEDSAAAGVDGNQADNTRAAAGAAYVFQRNGTTWSQSAYLKASNPGGGDVFGSAVAVGASTLVVGAPAEDSNATGVGGSQASNSCSNSGAAYVFVRSGATWNQEAYLKSSNVSSYASFGAAVAASGDTIAIAASEESEGGTGINQPLPDIGVLGSGATFVFVRDGATWQQQAYIKAANAGEKDYFGSALALVGDVLVVGANGEASAAVGVGGDQGDDNAPDAGAAYVFVRKGVVWTQQSYVKAANADSDDAFGSAAAIAGHWAIVGAPWEASQATGVDGDATDNGWAGNGAAYVFSVAGP